METSSSATKKSCVLLAVHRFILTSSSSPSTHRDVDDVMSRKNANIHNVINDDINFNSTR